MDDRGANTQRLLELEYERLQASIDKFDDQRFHVKGWAITVAGALLALGFNAREPLVILAGGFVSLFFAYMEIPYMTMQERVINRSNELEELLDATQCGPLEDLQPPYVFGIGKCLHPSLSGSMCLHYCEIALT